MKKIQHMILAALLLLLLSGCAVQPLEELYSPPRRSEEYNNLQSAMDSAMSDRQYCAPLSGEHQQTVQQADLDGDGEDEYLLFTKRGSDKPLQILIFRKNGTGDYLYSQTVEGTGSAFDQVEYVQMDGKPGLELVVGRQVSDQVLRSVSVYSFASGDAEKLLSTSYSKYLTVDLDRDSKTELMILRPGQAETQNGIAELYGVENGIMERSAELSMSGPVDRLKRVIIGKLNGGTPAVFVGTTVEENAIITDVYAVVGGVFTNVSFSNESGTSVKTLRNYYIYADDIDSDGEVELPSLINMVPVMQESTAVQQYLIRWYALKPNGKEVDKMYTFHDFLGGWYLQLDAAWANRISVEHSANAYAFYLWDEARTQATKIFTVFAFTGQSREEQAVSENRFVLYRGESTVYAAYMEVASGSVHISQEDLINSFQLIHYDWKTGET